MVGDVCGSQSRACGAGPLRDVDAAFDGYWHSVERAHVPVGAAYGVGFLSLSDGAKIIDVGEGVQLRLQARDVFQVGFGDVQCSKFSGALAARDFGDGEGSEWGHCMESKRGESGGQDGSVRGNGVVKSIDEGWGGRHTVLAVDAECGVLRLSARIGLQLS